MWGLFLRKKGSQMNIKINPNKIKVISIEDKNYPKKLRYIYDPPKVLYVLGDETILNKVSIAIIGCRECSEYGKQVSYQFAQRLAGQDIIVVSGLAKGVDTYAHQGTISIKKKTIAVLGCGLDIIYPVENQDLYRKIVENGGAIVSEYPLGTKPLRGNFPKRNRIISGLSDGVLVVEAKRRSGTLITVEHALEQGKDVYAVPGSIFSYYSEGTNELIKQGAIPVTCIEDFYTLWKR